VHAGDGGEVVVEIFRERVAGIDIGKADLKVCVRVPGRRAGTFAREVRTFGTTTRSLLKLQEWLLEQRVSLVGMESTGQYWRPVYYLLETLFECWLINPQHIKKVPGRKSDVTDAMWIAQLVQYGLVRPSFVPPPPIRRLRDLTRLRTNLVRDRSRDVQRVHDVLEDAGIKLAIVATDIMGVSGRAMITALIDGERDPETLAELALGRLRAKSEALTDALTGRFDDHHALQCRILLRQIDTINADIAVLDAQIDTEIEPFRDLCGRLTTIPGVGRTNAEILIAETGGDMSHFSGPDTLVSWAGMCPGLNESAGKRGNTRTRKGDRWLRGALGEAAQAAGRSKNTYLGTRFRDLTRRRGKKKAIVATGRAILEIAYWIDVRGTTYQDLGPDYKRKRVRDPIRRMNYLAQQIEALGGKVTLELPAA
jgi:transposase